MGMGPAYFTKLIFFLMPESASSARGYIMDQWTSRSMNLLKSDARFIKTVVSGNSRWVADSNDEGTYEAFCREVETLAAILSMRPDKAEELLFSEGRGKGRWRNYLKETDVSLYHQEIT